MAITDLYSKRMERARNGVSDVYSYDTFSPKFRVQLSMMVEDLLGNSMEAWRDGAPKECYELIVYTLRKEYGVRRLADSEDGLFGELHNFIVRELNIEKCLDAIELCYSIGDVEARKRNYREDYFYKAYAHVDDCIGELNARFKEAGYGYEFNNKEIFRIDSGFLHAEAVKPALHFLNAEGFDAARNEFLGAYEHYRHENYKEALVEAGKSFESTCKIILTANGWPYTPRDTANKLIQILIENGFIPPLHQSHLAAIQSLLSCGIPTLRNNLGGHGDGPEIVEVLPDVVAYGLHLTASAIVLLAGIQAQRGKA